MAARAFFVPARRRKAPNGLCPHAFHGVPGCGKGVTGMSEENQEIVVVDEEEQPLLFHPTV